MNLQLRNYGPGIRRFFLITVKILFLIFMFCSCGQKDSFVKKTDTPSDLGNQPDKGKGRITNPEMNQRFTRGDKITIKVESPEDSPGIDSVIFYTQSGMIGKTFSEPFTCEWDSRGCRTGENKIRVVVHYRNNTSGTNSVTIVILSDTKPQVISYEVVNVYPHDIQAYTQGLIYDDGYLYEGTGQYSESSLRKVEIKTGDPVRLLNLPGDIFGEGITIFNNRVYQLTYKSQVGFVYDKESFERIQRVYYQNREGWGLTHDTSRLIMSDGSHMIYFMDPEYFTELDRIEVFDDKGPVKRLNELEYINGKIFANIYGTEDIVIIDPGSGVITGRMNFSSILQDKDRHNRIDVFNGIAYNPENQRIFVTGKYWPRLFEIRLMSEP